MNWASVTLWDNKTCIDVTGVPKGVYWETEVKQYLKKYS